MKHFIFNQKPKRELPLDSHYVPMVLGNLAYEEAVSQSEAPVKISIAVERTNQEYARVDCFVFNDCLNQEEANFLYLERLIKTLIWLKGGFRIYFGGNSVLGARVRKAYSLGGLRAFDADFMSKVYQKEFEVIVTDIDSVPKAYETSKAIGRNLDGYRIGFDAGGSDRKVSAVVDGVAIYSEEVVWFPKQNSDPAYHYNGVMDSLKRAASKLPRVDAIGVSSAGIFIDNRVAVASLFRQVPQEIFDREVRDMYQRIQKEFGGIPLEVINDGDVTALAGSMNLDSNKVLGIAMGTSEAAGYVDALGNITGWLNELSFVPVDYNPNSIRDEWSDDYGVGVHYFSQDAVVKLARNANIEIDEGKSPAEKLKVVQELAEKLDKRALAIFDTIGVYLGYELAYYSKFYDIENVLILGRVTSGIGGSRILRESQRVLEEEFPSLAKQIKISLPDEMSRRVGQSIAAASLPLIKKVGV